MKAMDGRRFDEIAKSLARVKSRRRVVGAAVGVAAGALAGRFGVGEAATRSRCVGERCRRHAQCASGYCYRGRCTCLPNELKCGCGCCPFGEECCNPSCGICVRPGGACPEIFCEPPNCRGVTCPPGKFPDRNRHCKCVCLPNSIPCGEVCCSTFGEFCRNPATSTCGTRGE